MTDTAPAGVAAPSSGRTTLQLLRSLGSGPRGLTEAEAERRLARHGENVLPGTRPLSWPLLAARSLRDPFTVVLLCLGLVSATVAAWGTACVILVLVAVSCCLRSAGERRADSAMAGLRELVATTATVLRRPGADETASPAEHELPVSQLVPGDVVRLGPGDLIPADVRLLRAQGLTVQQAAFTGESVPADKRPVDVPADGESAHLCFQGGSVASGSASAVVLATGAGTRFAAAHRTVGAERGASAFDRSVHGISWTLIRFMLLTPPLVLMAGAALRGRGLETLPFAVAVAVGLTPEMLPVIVTTALARGSALLARTHGVIVKRLPALHDIGAVDILCVDKTGTLTQDRPAVDPARTDPDALHWAAVSAWWTLQLADLPTADALDEAVITHALAKDPAVTEAYDGITALPFDPVRRLATAVVRRPGALGTVTLAVKGSVENVLERCALDDAERASLLARAAEMSGDGLRLLAVATAERPARHRPGILPSPSGGGGSTADERGLTFTGFVAFTDALVPTAAQALRDLGERGVTVKVITGDHPGTASAPCAIWASPPATYAPRTLSTRSRTRNWPASPAAPPSSPAAPPPTRRASSPPCAPAGRRPSASWATAWTTCPRCAPPASGSARATRSRRRATPRTSCSRSPRTGRARTSPRSATRSPRDVTAAATSPRICASRSPRTSAT